MFFFTRRILSTVAHRTKHLIEYGALRALIALVNLLPLRAALACGWALAWLSLPLAQRRVREAMRRMRQVLGPGPSDRELRTWARISWRNLFFNAIELARAPQLNLREIDRRLEAVHFEKLLQMNREVGGFVLAVCHMGNWDYAGSAARLLGLPLFAIMRTQSNPLVNQYIASIRERIRFESVDRHRALGSVIKRMRAGQVFTILPDVRAKTADSAIRVPFLGGRAHLMGGMGLFAHVTGKPIVTTIVTRIGWTRHRWVVQDPVYPDPSADRDADILRMTSEVMARFDEAIRTYPEQYFWYNKRWVLDERF